MFGRKLGRIVNESEGERKVTIGRDTLPVDLIPLAPRLVSPYAKSKTHQLRRSYYGVTFEHLSDAKQRRVIAKITKDVAGVVERHNRAGLVRVTLFPGPFHNLELILYAHSASKDMQGRYAADQHFRRADEHIRATLLQALKKHAMGIAVLSKHEIELPA